ncbi:MAG TPA: hypothetical protein VJ894_05280 [Cryomorphaceae bacterium]|nr:hypothetical protein [Cryomorphaceae bacterium]
MAKPTVKVLDPKVSYTKSGEKLRVIVLGKIERWKEALLMAWVAAWIFCGGIVFIEWQRTTDDETQVAFFAFLVFWAYFLWRAGRTMLYRMGGNELIEVNQDELILKKSFFTYGKTKTYFLENVEEFKPIKLSKTSFVYTYENGWWNLGGEKLSFRYQGRYVKFAMQVDEKTVGTIYSLINRQIKENLKKKS